MSGADVTTFVVPGKPIAKARPRMTRNGHVYTPAKTTAQERAIAQIAGARFSKPVSGPVRLTVWVTFKTPKSWTKAKTAEHVHRPHTQKPDADNILKLVKDALNGTAYHDDAQVFEASVRKIWGLVDQTVITIEEVTPCNY